MTKVQFPALFAHVNLEKHFSDLKLIENVGQSFLVDNLLSRSIKTAIKDNIPAKKILLTLRDMAIDHFVKVEKMLGFDLAAKLRNYKP